MVADFEIFIGDTIVDPIRAKVKVVIILVLIVVYYVFFIPQMVYLAFHFKIDLLLVEKDGNLLVFVIQEIIHYTVKIADEVEDLLLVGKVEISVKQVSLQLCRILRMNGLEH